MQQLLVSIVMPAYNAEAYIALAIDSVLRQTWQNFELIIMDDGSQDETPNLIRQYASQDKRIRPVFNAKNLGVAESRNRGLRLSQGDYIAFLDSDDIWRPQKLEKQLQLAQTTGAAILYSSYALIDEKGKKKCNDYMVPSQVDYPSLLKCNVIGCSTVLLSREVAKRYHFERQYYHEDYRQCYGVSDEDTGRWKPGTPSADRNA